VVEHPCRKEGAAAADDTGEPPLPLELLQALQGQTAVEGHEINALPCLLLDDGEELVFFHVHYLPAVPDGPDPGLVDGHRAHRDLHLQYLPPDGLQVPPGAQVHDGVRPCLDGGPCLLQLGLHVGAVRGGAYVGVDFHPQALSDAQGPGMGPVGVPRDDGPAGRYLFHQLLGPDSFPGCDLLHLFGEFAPHGGLHLGHGCTSCGNLIIYCGDI